jgi:Glycosyltransferase
MKIVYSIGNISNSGGIERVLCTKANCFVEQLGYEVHIVLPKQSQSIFFPFSPKIKIHSLDLTLNPSKLSLFFSDKYRKEYKKKLSEYLMDIRPDVTISFFGIDATFLYQIKDGSRKVLEFHFTKNYLLHLGDSLTNDKLRWIRKYWLKLLMKREERLAGKYEHIVLLTEKDKQLWGGSDKFKVIPNPLSYESENVSPLNQKTIVSMGRLVLPKGFHYLVKAFSLLAGEFPDWTVQIYGEGQDKEYLNNLIKELSLQESVSIHAPITNVQEVMLNSSLFVFPSRYEGFGLVLTEAMECGVPCVAFDCECGPSDIIENGEDGLIAQLDNVENLTEKMKVLIKNDNLRLKMGKKAKQNVQRFQTKEVLKQWEGYFSTISNKA